MKIILELDEHLNTIINIEDKLTHPAILGMLEYARVCIETDVRLQIIAHRDQQQVSARKKVEEEESK